MTKPLRKSHVDPIMVSIVGVVALLSFVLGLGLATKLGREEALKQEVEPHAKIQKGQEGKYASTLKRMEAPEPVNEMRHRPFRN